MLNEKDDELKEINKLLGLALKAMNVNLFIQDRELHFVLVCNPAGFSEDDLLGKTNTDLLPSEEAKAISKLKRRVMKTGIAEKTTMQFTTQSGCLIYKLIIEPLIDENGNSIGILGLSKRGKNGS